MKTKRPRRSHPCLWASAHIARPGDHVFTWLAGVLAKSKTHKQKLCPGCGLFAIWVPK